MAPFGQQENSLGYKERLEKCYCLLLLFLKTSLLPYEWAKISLLDDESLVATIPAKIKQIMRNVMSLPDQKLSQLPDTNEAILDHSALASSVQTKRITQPIHRTVKNGLF